MLQMNDRCAALDRVCAAGFAMTEAALYLDTHPGCPQGLACFAGAKNQYEAAKAAYEASFGPLTQTAVTGQSGWTWVQGPWPWELEV